MSSSRPTSMIPASSTTNGAAHDTPEQTTPLDVKEFTYNLFKKSGKSWATLAVLGDPERSSKTNAAFVEGTSVAGEVRLDLDSGDAIHSVVVSLRGQIITGAHPNEMFPFLDKSVVLWSRSMGDPRQPRAGGPKWSQNLKGKYTWPFSIPVPPTVSLRTGGRDKVFRLPQSFFERHTRAQIEYELAVKFTRSKLRPGHRISTTLEYFPVSRPGPPSGFRQLAYEQHTALLGPDTDPEGWHTLPFIKTRGKLVASSRSVEIKCRLSLAAPLCYTRGSTIPCALLIECPSTPALDLLAVPESVILRLRRTVAFHTREKPQSSPSLDVTAKPVWKEEYQDSEMALWWPAADRALAVDSTETLVGEPVRRLLRGEIHLRDDLITSSSIAHYRIEYSVILFPFDAQGYASLDSEPLVSHPVEIASDYADGPRPLAYTTPFATRRLD